jgi:hypothetical protein
MLSVNGSSSIPLLKLIMEKFLPPNKSKKYKSEWLSLRRKISNFKKH